ncbi:MAG: sugar phosphate isomerase/epimerase [Paenibacillus sp.]|nr:sugar phosphate isomerase/epimerase [Paenibacillus sp.]
MKRLMFSKMLQEWTMEETALCARQLGFDGIDLTCREGGHIVPEQVKRELPRAVKLFAEQGLEVAMLTTSITSAEQKGGKETIEAAARCGVPFIKLGYWKLSGFGNAKQDLNRMRCDLDELEALAKANGVCLLLHLHGNRYLNANPALLWMLLADRDSRCIGAYADPGNMAVEGALYGWKLGLDLLAPYIRMVAFKNFLFEKNAGSVCAEWTPKLCPLQDGIVQYPQLFELLKAIEYDGYVSIHSEYIGASSWKKLDPHGRIEQARLDLAYLDQVQNGFHQGN